MDVDTKIRQLTSNKKSLTDFQRIFLAKGGSTGPMIVPYEFPELVADLNEVVPYDWGKLLHDKVDDINPHADTDGITQGGYKLVYLDHEPPTERGAAPGRGFGGPNVWYSLGLRIGGGRGAAAAGRGAAGGEGTISDVRYGGPADAAKLYPGQRIVAIDGKVYTPEVLLTAIADAKGNSNPIHLTIEHEGALDTYNIDYHDGNKYPVLQRVDGTPDYLLDIAAPLTKTEHSPGYNPNGGRNRSQSPQ
jgi:predicted metalloprotease with PDZ domain